MQDFIKRNLPQFIDNFDVIITNEKEEKYKVTAKDAVVTVVASKYICACNGITNILKSTAMFSTPGAEHLALI